MNTRLDTWPFFVIYNFYSNEVVWMRSWMYVSEMILLCVSGPPAIEDIKEPSKAVWVSVIKISRIPPSWRVNDMSCKMNGSSYSGMGRRKFGNLCLDTGWVADGWVYVMESIAENRYNRKYVCLVLLLSRWRGGKCRRTRTSIGSIWTADARKLFWSVFGLVFILYM